MDTRVVENHDEFPGPLVNSETQPLTAKQATRAVVQLWFRTDGRTGSGTDLQAAFVSLR
jgi:hypothetical protein